KRNRLDDVLERQVGRTGEEAVDLHLPRLGRERVSIGGGVALVDAELVEIIVAGNVLEGGRLLVRRKCALCKAELFGPCRRDRCSCEREPGGKREDFAPIEIDILRGDFG